MDIQDSRGGPCGWSGRSSGGQDPQRLWRMSEDTCVAAGCWAGFLPSHAVGDLWGGEEEVGGV